MGTALYEATTRLRDLPELELDSTPEDVVRAVRAAQCPGGICQEKIDGCYLELGVGVGGVIESVTSRAGLDHQYAQDWLGERVNPLYAGWTIQGEIVAGTHWASQQREAGALPTVYVYGMVRRNGRPLRHEQVTQRIRWAAHPSLRTVPTAGPTEDWGAFTAAVLARGGEGVVLRLPSGRYRAKPGVSPDRVVRRVYEARNRHGGRVWKAEVGGYRQGRSRPVTTQTVLVPEWALPLLARGRVVVVTGASVDPTGVVRHGRLGQVRVPGEVEPRACLV